MSDFETMLKDFSASAERYKFEQQQELHDFGGVDNAFDECRRQFDRERRATNLAHLIAERGARDDVLCHAVQQNHADGIWLNVEHVTLTGDERDLIAIAVAYLDARGLIERSGVSRHLIRLIQRSTP